MSYHRVCIYINTTGATSGAGTAYPSGAPGFNPGFSGIRVTRALVLCVCFVDRWLSFCPFSFGHCIVCDVQHFAVLLSCVYCFVCLRPVSCVPYVASFSGLSILDCPLTFLSLSFIHDGKHVAFESTNIYITKGKGRIK
jgi:hypothetical protein